MSAKTGQTAKRVAALSKSAVDLINKGVRRTEMTEALIRSLQLYKDGLLPLTPNLPLFPTEDTDLMLWKKFYRFFFEIEEPEQAWRIIKMPKVSGATKPPMRVIVVHQRIRTHRIITVCRQWFPVWMKTKDGDHTTETWRDFSRSANVMYAVATKDTAHPEFLLRHQSASKIHQDPELHGMNLKERLIFELMWFWEFRSHPDDGLRTICSDTTLSQTRWHPAVGWDSREGGLSITSVSPDVTFHDTAVRLVYPGKK